jgi:hypothetical protein
MGSSVVGDSESSSDVGHSHDWSVSPGANEGTTLFDVHDTASDDESIDGALKSALPDYDSSTEEESLSQLLGRPMSSMSSMSSLTPAPQEELLIDGDIDLWEGEDLWEGPQLMVGHKGLVE